MTMIPVPPPPRRVGTLFGTPVQADASAPLGLVGAFGLCWLLVADRYPMRWLPARLALAVIWTAILMGVFCLHSLGHILSARAAGAPMDTLLVNAIHWITLYYNSGVPPRAHIGRAAGGPLANGLGIALARGIRLRLPAGAFGRDLADVFLWFNAAIGAAALLPTPMFDGGAILKWTVYMRTGDLARASRSVHAAGTVMGGVLAGLASLALLFRLRLTGAALAALSVVTALESLRRD